MVVFFASTTALVRVLFTITSTLIIVCPLFAGICNTQRGCGCPKGSSTTRHLYASPQMFLSYGAPYCSLTCQMVYFSGLVTNILVPVLPDPAVSPLEGLTPSSYPIMPYNPLRPPLLAPGSLPSSPEIHRPRLYLLRGAGRGPPLRQGAPFQQGHQVVPRSGREQVGIDARQASERVAQGWLVSGERCPTAVSY